MAKTIGSVLTLEDKFSPVLGNVGNKINKFNDKIGGTNKNINNMSNNFGNNFKKMNSTAGSAFKGIGMKIGGLAAGLGFASFAKDSIGLASDLSEVQNVVDTTFGKNSETINKFSKDAIGNFGLSELQAKQFAGTIGSLGSGMGISGDNLSNFSTKLTGLSGDFASFYNLKPEEAFDKIKAGIVGSSEPLLSLGIDMRDAALETYVSTQKMDKSWKQMDGAEKTQVRFNYLMEKGKLATGDFVKTQSGFANQTRILKNNIQSAGASLAGIFLPPLNGVLQTFNKFMSTGNIQWVTDKVEVMADSFGKWLMPQLKSFSDWCTTKVYPALKEIGTGASDFYISHAPALEGAFSSVKDFAKDFAELGLYLVNNAFKWMADNKEVVEGVINGVGSAFDVAGDILSGNFNQALEHTLELLQNLSGTSWEDLKNYMSMGADEDFKKDLDAFENFRDKASIGNTEDMRKSFEEMTRQKIDKSTGLIPKAFDYKKSQNKLKNIEKGLSTIPKSTDTSIINLSGYANGTNSAKRGVHIVGEEGPELIDFKGGESVATADKTKKLLSSGGINLYITIQGNVIGNDELYDDVGQHITNRLSLALGNM